MCRLVDEGGSEGIITFHGVLTLSPTERRGPDREVPVLTDALTMAGRAER